MSSQAWKATLTIKTDDQSLQDVREWLAEHAASEPPPRRNDDALAKYLRLVLASNRDWDGVSLGIDVRRPRPVRMPWEHGFEAGPPTPEAIRADRDHARRRQFAVDCFALLVMLIVGATGFAAYHSRNHRADALPSSYTAHDVMAPLRQSDLAQGLSIP
ncbi:hypothetical protein [Bradyrhizobium sp. CCBAU 53380]|uniref:hypothetical protein n=1 Tax=Bradyrhizobium sp. CCBAU 53380 TaxID=1325117 RepID=UPI00230387CD|nr:hypothetical protein [Bradyrhizobium sp. CCBAU 53380]MDA9426236.1 hypothetical protein [Bradyrhizobium sp. CCBAU 53380]